MVTEIPRRLRTATRTAIRVDTPAHSRSAR